MFAFGLHRLKRLFEDVLTGPHLEVFDADHRSLGIGSSCAVWGDKVIKRGEPGPIEATICMDADGRESPVHELAVTVDDVSRGKREGRGVGGVGINENSSAAEVLNGTLDDVVHKSVEQRVTRPTKFGGGKVGFVRHPRTGNDTLVECKEDVFGRDPPECAGGSARCDERVWRAGNSNCARVEALFALAAGKRERVEEEPLEVRGWEAPFLLSLIHISEPTRQAEI